MQQILVSEYATLMEFSMLKNLILSKTVYPFLELFHPIECECFYGEIVKHRKKQVFFLVLKSGEVENPFSSLSQSCDDQEKAPPTRIRSQASRKTPFFVPSDLRHEKKPVFYLATNLKHEKKLLFYLATVLKQAGRCL